MLGFPVPFRAFLMIEMSLRIHPGFGRPVLKEILVGLTKKSVEFLKDLLARLGCGRWCARAEWVQSFYATSLYDVMPRSFWH